MEEDIKVLEELIKPIKIINYNEYETPIFEYKINKLEREAIENLIKRNKELEIENKTLKAHKNSCPALPTTGVECEFKKDLEKLQELLDTKYIAMFEGDTEFPDDATIMKTVKYVKVSDIEELLQEGDDK